MEGGVELESEWEEHCTICLQPFVDRAILPTCAHEFCFECILLWAEQSRKCPLCNRPFDSSSRTDTGGSYLIHHLRSKYDYQKYYLPPLLSSPSSSGPAADPESRLRDRNQLQRTIRRRRERQWGSRRAYRAEEQECAEERLEQAIAKRRWVYEWGLYAKHVASNRHTRYRPFPTPSLFASSPDLIGRMTMWLRRELRVWPNLDVEFLTLFTVSLMKSIDIRSESAIKLLAEFLDMDEPYVEGARYTNAEHFAHEIYCYLRSPYRDLAMYDQMVQVHICNLPALVQPMDSCIKLVRYSTQSALAIPRRSRESLDPRLSSPSPIPSAPVSVSVPFLFPAPVYVSSTLLSVASGTPYQRASNCRAMHT
ncbi:hypothetical protein EDD17DRAFT_1477759 [Pisolithus thermaeus]|nr:hypothetical protein EV401DRAFT_1850307 [Pisolithus croceorrhizus]KAI6162733.1 hypothetical protein EDD17DRAFT_1477759 [Pisolithus thermaeus]